MRNINSDAGELDVHDNAVIVDYSGPLPLATQVSLLKRGYNAWAWDGKGIDSSSAAADPTARTALAGALPGSFPATLREDVASAFASVPEPGAAAGVFVGLVAALPRRRRSRRIPA